MAKVAYAENQRVQSTFSQSPGILLSSLLFHSTPFISLICHDNYLVRSILARVLLVFVLTSISRLQPMAHGYSKSSTSSFVTKLIVAKTAYHDV